MVGPALLLLAFPSDYGQGQPGPLPIAADRGYDVDNTFAKIKILLFVGWVERRPNPTFALGSVSLHPTYKKMAKVFVEKPGFFKKPGF